MQIMPVWQVVEDRTLPSLIEMVLGYCWPSFGSDN